jgi:hypothetical protein
MLNKKQAIKEAKEYKGTTQGICFTNMLHACIYDLRMKNDSADNDQVLRNQGAIAELKALAKALSLTGGYSEHNGAFDE